MLRAILVLQMVEMLSFRRYGRFYIFLPALFLPIVAVIKVLAGISFGVALIAAVGGLFANGILLYLGERRHARQAESGSLTQQRCAPPTKAP